MEEVEQKAYLLHSRPYRDNKVIAEFLTEFHGKVSAVAYISSSIKSAKKALLQPFTPLTIVLKGQGNLKTLARIENHARSFLLTGDHLYSGFYLNELQVRLLGELIPADALYRAYHHSLQRLNSKEAIEPILRDFENILLDELGLTIDYSPVFEQNYHYFRYLPEQGFQPVDDLGAHGYPREHLELIAQQIWSDNAVKQTYKLLMRQVFEHLLGGQPLNSRKLFTRK